MTPSERTRLVEVVQANCHLADARHAADMTLCTYLLQMREFYRWERALPFGASLPRDEVGTWIAEREALWDALLDTDYRRLPLDGAASGAGPVDPFDVATVNAALRPEGLLYGAGLVGSGRAVFFLGELHGHEHRDGLDVVTAGRELARGLLAPPAALATEGGAPVIVLRREALARWCWERFEAYSLRPGRAGAFRAVVEAYGLERDFHGALPRWLDEQCEMLRLHELGEHRAGEQLGPEWSAMRLALPSRRAELQVRAVRDQLADLQVTLPSLLARRADVSVHAWFAAYDGMREQLFPSLEAGYRAWRDGDEGARLRAACAVGAGHFHRLAQRLLALYREHGAAGAPAIESLLSSPAAICRDA